MKAGFQMNKKRSIIIFTSVLVLFLVFAGVWNYRQLIFNSNTNPNNKLEYYGGPGPTTYRFPGEFEKQQAIWMQWPSAVYNEGNRPVNPVIINIIKAFDPYIRINLMSVSTNEITQIQKLLKSNGYTGKNLHYYVINHLSIWTRDVGPIFVKDNKNMMNVVNFGFNNYSRDGSQFYINTESQVDKLVAQYFKLPIINTNLVSEGGAIESNGRGTLMVPESVALTRNPGMTKLQIENEYKRVLGLKKLIWLKKGLKEDDGITSGHINEFARFADPNTILLAQVLPGDRYANSTSQESYRRLEENYNILLKSTDQDGKPFRIIRIPMPPTLYSQPDSSGNIPVRSYLNYAVTNGALLMQSYVKPGRSATLAATEAKVKGIFQNVFPGRKVIGIDAENVNLWGGGIHCITQHMPEY
jgi:agmatine deiminase